MSCSSRSPGGSVPERRLRESTRLSQGGRDLTLTGSGSVPEITLSCSRSSTKGESKRTAGTVPESRLPLR